ncbi:uncharacterized protein LOC113769902 [Coffea eugenioides]|uniref:uncharacterized protein LOC113769902 n=1 Tax=Coffea eugenioides TaxID=49369 RepID=UPI000F6090BA|nr:uncharacterized protein LOC113769902 [Coffea eugenioides]
MGYAVVSGGFIRSSNQPTTRTRFPTTTLSHPISLAPSGNTTSSSITTSYESLKIKKSKPRISALAEVSSFTSDPARAVVTWQIVVGALAGITPFMVAGIEFGKRIVKQRQCGECKGSGLVLRTDQQYIRCPACGGWLPWQSWRRFFTG